VIRTDSEIVMKLRVLTIVCMLKASSGRVLVPIVVVTLNDGNKLDKWPYDF
jgi:hypothetical protein